MEDKDQINSEVQKYQALAGYLYKQGMLDQAAAALQKLLDLDPNNSSAHNDLGNIFQQLEEFEKAISEYQAAIRSDPTNHEPHNNIGIIYTTQGKPGEAVREFEIARKLCPDYPDVYNNLGVIYYDLQQFDDAILMYEKALELRPDYPMARLNLERAKRQKQQANKPERVAQEKRIGKHHQKRHPSIAVWLFWLIAVPVSIYSATIDLRLGALVAGFLCACMLVFILNYDLRFASNNDLEFYRFFPSMARVFSVIKETLKLLVPAAVLGYAVILICMWVFNHLGFAHLAALLGSGDHSPLFPFNSSNSVYWMIVLGIVLISTGVKDIKCQKVPYYPYDIFISYKSQNVLLARQIAERLIASGFKVWFAEYELLVKDQLMLQEMPLSERMDLINAAIQQGVMICRYGLVLTNNRYADSEYCRFEAENLIRLLGSQNVFEVMIPPEDSPHQKCEGLSLCSSMVYQGSLEDVLEFISNHTGWKLKPMDARPGDVSSQTYKGKYLGHPYMLDMGGWELQKPGEETPDLTTQNQKGPSFIRKVEGGVLSIGLILGVDFGIDNYRTELARTEVDVDDDRKLYDHLIQIGGLLMSKLKARARGVHLVHQGEHGQFALTYNLWGALTRTYSIILGIPETNRLAEFVFTCGGTEMTFKGFCEHAYLYDEVILSLRWC